MDPITMSLIASAISAGGSALSGVLGKKDKQVEAKRYQTSTQKKQSQLVDDLLSSLSGNGKYNDLFQMDQDAFERSYAEPARARFRNQTAPAIQQQYIASGQQRGSSMEDALMRAGVDMDQLLNEHYSQFQENALNRKSNAITGILGAPSYEQYQQYTDPNVDQSSGSAAKQGLAGYLTGGFGKDLGGLLNSFNQQPSAPGVSTAPDAYGISPVPDRQGFQPSPAVYRSIQTDPTIRWGNRDRQVRSGPFG